MAIARAKERIDPEDPLGIPAAPMVEWYRLDAGKRILRFLVVGASAMTVGSLAIARLMIALPRGAMWARSMSPVRAPMLVPNGTIEGSALAWGAGGLALMIVGGLIAIVGLQRVLREESYLALRVDGILFVHGEARRYVRWEHVSDVRWDAARQAVVIERDDDEDWLFQEKLAGVDGEGLAKVARTVRRRALFGMYARP